MSVRYLGPDGASGGAIVDVGSHEYSKIKVFVSYSRIDLAFADLVVEALASKGFDPLIDRSAIEKGEDWWARIVDLIADSAAVVFVVSPDSVASSICARELELVKKLGLRVVPVIFRTTPWASVPKLLSEKNAISCEALGRLYGKCAIAAQSLRGAFGRDADAAELDELEKNLSALHHDFRAQVESLPEWIARLEEIERALTLDAIIWRREAGAWMRRAQNWEAGGRPADFALSSGEAATLRLWQARRPRGADMPTTIVAFLEASERIVAEREESRRRIVGRAFVAPSETELEKGRQEDALRLAAAGAVLSEDLGHTLVPQLGGLALRAIRDLRTVAVIEHESPVNYSAWSPDGRQIVTSSGFNGLMCVWDVNTATQTGALSGYRASWSPDGERVVTVAGDDFARIYDARTCTEIARLDSPGSKMWDALWSPDGVHIATISEFSVTGHGNCAAWSADARRLISTSPGHIWRVETGEIIAKLSAPCVWEQEAVRELPLLKGHKSVCWSKDAERILSVSEYSVWIWEGKRGRQLRRLEQGNFLDHVLSAAWSRDDQRIVTTSQVTPPCIWDAKHGRAIARLEGTSASVSPDGGRILTSAERGPAILWDADTGRQIARLEGTMSAVLGDAWSPDGRNVLIHASDYCSRVWETESRREIARVMKPEVVLRWVASWSNDGKRVFTSGAKFAQVSDAESGQVLLRIRGRGHSSYVKLSPDGVLAAAAFGGSDAAAVWNVDTGREVARIRGGKGAVWSPDGSYLATSSFDGAVYLWEARSGSKQAEFRGIAGAWSPDGNFLITHDCDRNVCVWSIRDGQNITSLRGHEGAVRRAVWRADSLQIATVSDDNTARIWDALDGREVAYLKLYQGMESEASHDAAWSPDGMSVVTGHHGTAALWRADSWRDPQLLHYSGSTNVLSVAWSSDGRRIVTASDDGTARIWEANSRSEISVLQHDGAVRFAGWTPDGRRIVTVCDSAARLWDVARTEALAVHPRALLTSAALVRGLGAKRRWQGHDLLMADAPDDLHVAIREGLSEEQQAQVCTIGEVLRASFHANCYLSPTQFGEMFGS